MAPTGAHPPGDAKLSSACSPGPKYLKSSAVAVVRLNRFPSVLDALGEEQLLQALLVVERGLHPQVGGARQNAFCERQDAFYVEFVDPFGVVVDF